LTKTELETFEMIVRIGLPQLTILILHITWEAKADNHILWHDNYPKISLFVLLPSMQSKYAKYRVKLVKVLVIVKLDS